MLAFNKSHYKRIRASYRRKNASMLHFTNANPTIAVLNNKVEWRSRHHFFFRLKNQRRSILSESPQFAMAMGYFKIFRYIIMSLNPYKTGKNELMGWNHRHYRPVDSRMLLSSPYISATPEKPRPAAQYLQQRTMNRCTYGSWSNEIYRIHHVPYQ